MADYWIEQVALAEVIAREAHHGQTRHDKKTPYVTHPEALAGMFDDFFRQCVSWLHDVIEDSDFTKELLVERGVDEDVVDVVVALTHDPSVSYHDYIISICTYPDPTAQSVKLGDMVINLSDSPSENQKVKYRKYAGIILSHI